MKSRKHRGKLRKRKPAEHPLSIQNHADHTEKLFGAFGVVLLSKDEKGCPFLNFWMRKEPFTLDIIRKHYSILDTDYYTLTFYIIAD